MKFKVEGTEYEVPIDFTLGELRLLKRDFAVEDVEAFNPRDPDHVAGVLFIAMRRTRPDITVEEIDRIAKVDVVEEDEPAPDPTSGAGEGAGA